MMEGRMGEGARGQIERKWFQRRKTTSVRECVIRAIERSPHMQWACAKPNMMMAKTTKKARSSSTAATNVLVMSAYTGYSARYVTSLNQFKNAFTA